MKQITFHLETLTPMFLAGANQAVFELRPPSFKGLLRFWWRAYYWGNQPDGMKYENIRTRMSEAEGDIFGIASDNGNKSRFSLRVKPARIEGARKPFPKHLLKSLGGKDFPINILEYLAYGTYEYQRGKGNRFIRDYLPPGTKFDLILSLPDTEAFRKQEEDVVMSVYLLATCGGVGAKSRNGFGNLRILSITEKRSGEQEESPYAFDLPLSFPPQKFFLQHIKNGASKDKLPDFTALSRQMQIFKLKETCSSWHDCLAQLGEIYRSCKGRLDESLRCDKRQYIAAPITIQQRVGGRWKTYDSSFLERRAKPYFLRVAQSGDAYEGYILYLPSRYCPDIERDGKKDRDRYNNIIDQRQADEKFWAACKEFNGYLREERMLRYYPEQ